MTGFNHNRATHRASVGEPLWRQWHEIAADHKLEEANAQLAADTNAAFVRFERRHGLQPGEGRVLLLETGVRL